MSDDAVRRNPDNNNFLEFLSNFGIFFLNFLFDFDDMNFIF